MKPRERNSFMATKEKKPSDKVYIQLNKPEGLKNVTEDGLEITSETFRVDGKETTIPYGKIVPVSRSLAKILKDSGKISSYTEL